MKEEKVEEATDGINMLGIFARSMLAREHGPVRVYREEFERIDPEWHLHITGTNEWMEFDLVNPEDAEDSKFHAKEKEEADERKLN